MLREDRGPDIIWACIRDLERDSAVPFLRRALSWEVVVFVQVKEVSTKARCGQGEFLCRGERCLCQQCQGQDAQRLMPDWCCTAMRGTRHRSCGSTVCGDIRLSIWGSKRLMIEGMCMLHKQHEKEKGVSISLYILSSKLYPGSLSTSKHARLATWRETLRRRGI